MSGLWLVSANVIDDTAANTGLADAASVASKVTKAASQNN
jgi:hypothetical protein